MAEIIKIADAVVSHLNGGGFDAPFSAKRMYLPRFDLKDMIALHVSVVPKATVITIADRRRTQHDHSIDIAVQKRLNPDIGISPSDDPDTDELDGLMNLVESISNRLRFHELADFPDAVWVGLTNDPIYSLEHLEQMRQLTSILTVTYRTMQPVVEVVT